MMVVFTVCLFQPIIRNVNNAIILIRDWLLVSKQAKHTLDES